jgi:hypothetical protein
MTSHEVSSDKTFCIELHGSLVINLISQGDIVLVKDIVRAVPLYLAELLILTKTGPDHYFDIYTCQRKHRHWRQRRSVFIFKRRPFSPP